MGDFHKYIYKCYLGKEKSNRLLAITKFVLDLGGRHFFDQFSTTKDSIRDFLIKCESLDLSLY